MRFFALLIDVSGKGFGFVVVFKYFFEVWRCGVRGGARSLVAEILACGCSGAKGQATNTEYQILRPFTARILHKKYSTCSKNLHVVQSRI
jgi:hypothetical protein